MNNIILASKSRVRKKILETGGIFCEVTPSSVDEDTVKESLLKENGTLIVAVPNFKSYDAKHYKKDWAAFDVPRHIWHFSKKAISYIFSKYKMKIIRIKPMLFDAFYVALLSESYRKNKWKYFKAVYIGILSNLKGIKNKNHSSLIYIIKNKN